MVRSCLSLIHILRVQTLEDSTETALDFRMAALPASAPVEKSWFAQASFVGDSLTPVSYTHLDVYKRQAVKAYQAEAARKSDFERSELNKEKTGVQLDGVMGINPVRVSPAVVPKFTSAP